MKFYKLSYLPIRERREELQKDIPSVYKILYEGSQKAREVAAKKP